MKISIKIQKDKQQLMCYILFYAEKNKLFTFFLQSHPFQMKATEFHFWKIEGIINTVGKSADIADLYSTTLYYMVPAFVQYSGLISQSSKYAGEKSQQSV